MGTRRYRWPFYSGTILIFMLFDFSSAIRICDDIRCSIPAGSIFCFAKQYTRDAFGCEEAVDISPSPDFPESSWYWRLVSNFRLHRQIECDYKRTSFASIYHIQFLQVKFLLFCDRVLSLHSPRNSYRDSFTVQQYPRMAHWGAIWTIR